MEITQYAPVVIPTLSRFEHFRRCLESLERCTGADKTDVYIGLDYPPSEKYVEGWKKIDAYLVEKENNNGFKSLYVRRRDHNCGVGKEGSNGWLLIKEVKAISDTYISTEDDNEFSPNFLEFINKGLMLYKDNPDIILVSGYSYPSVKEMGFPNNVVSAKIAAAWGAGHWTQKPTPYQIVGGANYRDGVLKSWTKSFRLYIKRPISLNTFLSMKFRNKTYGDCLNSTSFVLENKYCIFPKISKVRNWGHDGTGIHCSTTDVYIKQEIDNASHFDYDEMYYVNNFNNRRFSKNGVINSFILFISSLGIGLRYIVYRLLNKDLFGFYFNKRG